MAQSVWMDVPSSHRYKIVDITGQPDAKPASLEAIGAAPNGEGAIVAAVAHAAQQQRRITSITRFNMEILMIVD
jgi:hypothetical protein